MDGYGRYVIDIAIVMRNSVDLLKPRWTYIWLLPEEPNIFIDLRLLPAPLSRHNLAEVGNAAEAVQNFFDHS